MGCRGESYRTKTLTCGIRCDLQVDSVRNELNDRKPSWCRALLGVRKTPHIPELGSEVQADSQPRCKSEAELDQIPGDPQRIKDSSVAPLAPRASHLWKRDTVAEVSLLRGRDGHSRWQGGPSYRFPLPEGSCWPHPVSPTAVVSDQAVTLMEVGSRQLAVRPSRPGERLGAQEVGAQGLGIQERERYRLLVGVCPRDHFPAG